ncbi:ParB/RepB/Spo0J family partition protein [Streptomyces sp. NPDC059740]|uniref:ParB/RepB/Spo0J family partition protein n=1 Tax=Streptomyces sp. NPDC059740 TaxID=3346926 RepID=UPI0036585782
MKKSDKLGRASSFSRASEVSDRRRAIAEAAGTSLEEYEHEEPRAEKLATKLISQNPDNPREDLGDVSELAQTLVEIGLVNAITVVTREAYLAERPDRAGELDEGSEYVVVDGHRRLEAAKKAGLEELKYTVDDHFASSDEKLLEAAFVANAHAEHMSELEEAAALDKLVKFYGSQTKAAERLGRTQAFISQRLSLLRLDPSLQADLSSGRRKVEHVRGLSKLPSQQQRERADARAAEAERKAADKKKRKGAKTGGSPSAHNGVMASGGGSDATSGATHTTATYNGVMGDGTGATSNDTAVTSAETHNGVMTPASAEQQSITAEDTAEPQALVCDWTDVDVVRDSLSKVMPPESLRKLAEIILAH